MDVCVESVASTRRSRQTHALLDEGAGARLDLPVRRHVVQPRRVEPLPDK